MTRIRTHEVATAAYAAVSAHTNDSSKEKKKYGALAHKLPGLILQNGLAQASGFLLAKGKEEHLALLDDLRSVLHATRVTTAANRDTLHREIIGAELAESMLLTRRALDASGWIKRYVQGVLRVDATGESQDQEANNGG